MSPAEKLRHVSALARGLLDRHGLHDWAFSYNRRRCAMGVCLEGPKAIQLSAYFVILNSEEAIRDTLLHEMAHALVGTRHGHGPAWKAKCLEIGAKPERVSFTVLMPDGTWQARCEGCGAVHHRHRKPKHMRGWWCGHCGREKGSLTWQKAG